MTLVGGVIMYVMKPLSEYVEKLSEEENENYENTQELVQVETPKVTKETQEIFDWVFKEKSN